MASTSERPGEFVTKSVDFERLNEQLPELAALRLCPGRQRSASGVFEPLWHAWSKALKKVSWPSEGFKGACQWEIAPLVALKATGDRPDLGQLPRTNAGVG